jgi:hypothetical protein
MSFASPVQITANTTYVASYAAPNGGFALNRPYFDNPFDNAPLHALLDGLDGANGVYNRTLGAFPTSTYQSSNYWVDVVYTRTAPPTVASKTPAPGTLNVPLTTTVKVTFSRAMNPATITTSSVTLAQGTTQVPATVTYDPATLTATLTPSAPLSPSLDYIGTVTNQVAAADGVPLQQNLSWSFTTAAS